MNEPRVLYRQQGREAKLHPRSFAQWTGAEAKETAR
jgi:hypothetical protein